MPDVFWLSRIQHGSSDIHEATAVKMTLNQSIIINKLPIETKPELDSDGRVVYVPDISGKPYLITDNHRDSPVGFDVKSSATKNTCIIQRTLVAGVLQKANRPLRSPEQR